MKLGVMNPAVASMPFEEAMKYLSSLGIDCVELGAGGYPGDAHIKPCELIGNPENVEKIKNILKENNLEISAISCHGNPLHPNKVIAEKFHNDFKNAILVAELLGVETIIGFSGCPGDCEESKNPNWVTCAWPADFAEVLEWQWNEKVIPYWKDMAVFAKEHNITKIAFELHPGFVVYNPETLLRLREAVGDIVAQILTQVILYGKILTFVQQLKL